MTSDLRVLKSSVRAIPLESLIAVLFASVAKATASFWRIIAPVLFLPNPIVPPRRVEGDDLDRILQYNYLYLISRTVRKA